jgi:capsular polysaccharide export protein
LLEHGEFDPSVIVRACRLRETIVAAGIGKYDRDGATLDRFDDRKRHILVAGQVEDDRSILTGGAGLASNLELLKQVRAREPDAFLIYKPHPDVVAGHRKGDIPGHICRQIADKVVTNASISSIIAMVDEVHVNTSLAGFEALMRHKMVTAYGVPFYSGWGLTCDLGPVPARRTRQRSLDELVAATLLVYPRYLDPVSGLPCPAEVVVDRLCAGEAPATGILVSARRLHGKVRRYLQGFAR